MQPVSGTILCDASDGAERVVFRDDARRDSRAGECRGTRDVLGGSRWRASVYAMLFLPGLVAAGAFLALAFARNQRWIGKLYAADLSPRPWRASRRSPRFVSVAPAVIVVVAGLAAAGRCARRRLQRVGPAVCWRSRQV